MGKRKAKSHNLICPHCGEDSLKTLKKGNLTRCCGQKVVKVNGAIYANLDDAPEWQILQCFIAHKRKRDKLPDYDIEYGDTCYQVALPAAQNILKRCKDDVVLAKQVIEVSFTHKRHKWRTYADLFALAHMRYFPDALAIASKQLQQQRQDDQRQDERRVTLEGTITVGMQAAYAESMSI